jgi:hypothetical protein
MAALRNHAIAESEFCEMMFMFPRLPDALFPPETHLIKVAAQVVFKTKRPDA